MERFFNFSFKKVGGVRFLKLGRLFFSFGISKAYRPIKGTLPHAEEIPLRSFHLQSFYLEG